MADDIGGGMALKQQAESVNTSLYYMGQEKQRMRERKFAALQLALQLGSCGDEAELINRAKVILAFVDED